MFPCVPSCSLVFLHVPSCSVHTFPHFRGFWLACFPTVCGSPPNSSWSLHTSISKIRENDDMFLQKVNIFLKMLRFLKFQKISENFKIFLDFRDCWGTRLGLVWCTEREFGDVLWCFGKLGVRSFWKCYLVRNHFWKCYLVRDDKISEIFGNFVIFEENWFSNVLAQDFSVL